MSGWFINMLGPWQWAALACVPPAIISLYFLKLRRKPLEVPSTYLWRKSIEDMHVNSLWQRMRKSVLLLLQLLLVLLAMLAVLRPGFKGTTLTADQLIFLVDNSASMAASDVTPSRLEEAKRRVGDLIDQMPSGGRAMIVSFSDGAQVVQEFTDNRALLRQRLRTIRPTNHTTRIDEALQLAIGIAQSAQSQAPGSDADDPTNKPPPAELFIFSDGGFPETSDISLSGISPNYIPIGEATAENFAISAFRATPHELKPDEWQAFARVSNFGAKTATRTVELYIDDQLADAKQIEIEPGAATGIAFELGEAKPGALRLVLGEEDDLAIDNVAFAVIDRPRRTRALFISPGNGAVRRALATSRAAEMADIDIAMPGILQDAEHQQRVASGMYDLVIYDQCSPEIMPEANTLFIGRLPPTPTWQSSEAEGGAKTAAPLIIDIQRAHPIMHLIELDDVLIAESHVLAVPQGGTSLIDSDRGVLMAIAPRGGFEDAVLGFEIIHTEGSAESFVTNWPVGRLSFPTFCLNALEYLGVHSQTGEAGAILPGKAVTIAAGEADEEMFVHGPGGLSQRLTGAQQGAYHFQETEQPGYYEAVVDDEVAQRFAVNMFDDAESAIPINAEEGVGLGYVKVAGRTQWTPARRELWKFVLVLVLAVLLLEWYIYNRRVYV